MVVIQLKTCMIVVVVVVFVAVRTADRFIGVGMSTFSGGRVLFHINVGKLLAMEKFC